MTDCVFCKIIRGDLPSRVVYENDLVMAFDDINPSAPVHVVVVPKEHIPTIMDIPEDKAYIAQAMLLAAREVAKNKGIDQKGFRIITNCNREGGQVIYHLHLHVLGGRQLSSAL